MSSFEETIIRNRLKELNDKNGGETLFEKLAIKAVSLEHPEYHIFESSGLSAGGDGGRDGSGLFEDGKVSIAASINCQTKEKLTTEINNCRGNEKVRIFFFLTNQKIGEKKIVEYEKITFKDTFFTIHILDLEKMIKLVSRYQELQTLLGVLLKKKELTLSQIKDNFQLKDVISDIIKYIPRKIVYDSNNNKNDSLL